MIKISLLLDETDVQVSRLYRSYIDSVNQFSGSFNLTKVPCLGEENIE